MPHEGRTRSARALIIGGRSAGDVFRSASPTITTLPTAGRTISRSAIQPPSEAHPPPRTVTSLPSAGPAVVKHAPMVEIPTPPQVAER